MNYLISYPRSGNTFTRYIIEFMSGMKSIDQMAEETNQHISREQSPLLHPNAPTIISKRHNWIGVTETDKVIFVLRDYKEAIIRNNIGKRKVNLNLFEKINNGADGGYMGLLERYDNFKGEKLLIYYEDLIDPNKYITDKCDMLKDIANFLNIDEPDSEEFIEKYNQHKTKSLSFYPKSQSRGKGKDYHKNRLNNDGMLINWKNYLTANYTELYDKYLKHYN